MAVLALSVTGAPAQSGSAGDAATASSRESVAQAPCDGLSHRKAPQRLEVLKGSSILDARVHDTTGLPIGQVRDMIIDGDGRVVALLLHVVLEEVEHDGCIVVPTPLLTPRFVEPDEVAAAGECAALTLGAAFDLLADAPSCEVGVPPAERELARVYEHFGIPIPWKRAAVDDAGGMDLDAGALRRTSARNVIRADVVDDTGRTLGEITDLALAARRQPIADEVLYAVLECDRGFMGIDAKSFAVPWESLRRTADGSLTLEVTASELEEAEGFDGRWPEGPDGSLFAHAPDDPLGVHNEF